MHISPHALVRMFIRRRRRRRRQPCAPFVASNTALSHKHQAAPLFMLPALQRAASSHVRSALALCPPALRCFAVVTEPRAFAVVKVLGSQYKVVPSDKIVTAAMPGAIGQEIKFSDVLLVGSASSTIIGTPLVEHSYVTAVVEEQTLADKVRDTKH
jgi:ribosomal protein L21